MSIPAEFEKQFAKFPECLRTIVEAELADGNSVLEICGGFPAAPCGECLKLARQVAACRRESVGGVKFYERNNSDYFGEFTTEDRHFFILEPPNPPEPPPDMDAIREAMNVRQRAADAELYAAQRVEAEAEARAAQEREDDTSSEGRTGRVPKHSHHPSVRKSAGLSGAVARFAASMEGTMESWREGTGYDLALLKSATPEELESIEEMILSRPVEDWRDVEALAALDSPRARVALRKALKSSDHRVATAVAEYAPHLVSDAERTKVLVAALEGAEIYGGLTQALLDVEEYHPPEIVDALFRGLLKPNCENPVHFAAMLMFIHGKADSSFDWTHRPLFLRFKTEDRAERESVFRELCEKIGVDPERHLKAARGKTAKGGKQGRSRRR